MANRHSVAVLRGTALQILSGVPTGLYVFSATTGTGKTTIATALGCEYIVKSVGQSLREGHGNSVPYVYYVNMPQFLERVKQMYQTEEALSSVNDTQERMIQAQLLILDDMGVTYASESVQERLLSILEQRYDRSNVYTSNCSLGQLEDRVGQRIVSRIAGSTVEVQLRGADYRKGEQD